MILIQTPFRLFKSHLNLEVSGRKSNLLVNKLMNNFKQVFLKIKNSLNLFTNLCVTSVGLFGTAIQLMDHNHRKLPIVSFIFLVQSVGSTNTGVLKMTTSWMICCGLAVS